MPRAPQVNARRLIAALRRAGFVQRRQTGSHVILRHPVTRRTTSVPRHSGALKPELVAEILRQAGLTADDLRDLLK